MLWLLASVQRFCYQPTDFFYHTFLESLYIPTKSQDENNGLALPPFSINQSADRTGRRATKDLISSIEVLKSVRYPKTLSGKRRTSY